MQRLDSVFRVRTNITQDKNNGLFAPASPGNIYTHTRALEVQRAKTTNCNWPIVSSSSTSYNYRLPFGILLIVLFTTYTTCTIIVGCFKFCCQSILEILKNWDTTDSKSDWKSDLWDLCSICSLKISVFVLLSWDCAELIVASKNPVNVSYQYHRHQ